MVDHVFEYYDSPEHKNVKLVAIKMRKSASIWWENLKRQCERNGKKKIQTWEKMKKELKRKYISFNYCQDIYLKIQNLKQQDLSVEEYSAEFENLIIDGDLQESKEQVIACYLVGLRFDIARVICMQPYSTLEGVIKLALKVRHVAKEGFVMDLTSKNPSDAKTTPKPQVQILKHKPHQESTLKRCFKCQGLGHTDFECPNQKVIALIKEDEAKEDVEEVVESNHVQEDKKRSLL